MSKSKLNTIYVKPHSYNQKFHSMGTKSYEYTNPLQLYYLKNEISVTCKRNYMFSYSDPRGSTFYFCKNFSMFKNVFQRMAQFDCIKSVKAFIIQASVQISLLRQNPGSLLKMSTWKLCVCKCRFLSVKFLIFDEPCTIDFNCAVVHWYHLQL